MAIKKVAPRRGIYPDYDPQGEVLPGKRELVYFAKPRGKKLTEYEKLTLYAQPNPDWVPGGLDWGDYPSKFTGGRDTWGNYFTELKCQDWFAFRDPSRRWQYPYVSEKADEWRTLQRRLNSYAEMRSWESIDPWWCDEILTKVWGGFLHHEYGVFNAMSSVCRDVLSDIIRTATCTAAFDLLDNSQMIQMQRLYLSKLMPDSFKADCDSSKEMWEKDAIYAPAIKMVDELWDRTSDHGEIMFVIFMMHEALYGRFVREIFMASYAPLFGDTLSALFLPDMKRADQISRNWNFDFFHNILGNDPEFGPMNRKIMQAWLDRWLPKTLACVQAFQAVFDKPEIKKARDGLNIESPESRFETILEDWKTKYLDPVELQVDLAQAKKLAGC